MFYTSTLFAYSSQDFLDVFQNTFTLTNKKLGDSSRIQKLTFYCHETVHETLARWANTVMWLIGEQRTDQFTENVPLHIFIHGISLFLYS